VARRQTNSTGKLASAAAFLLVARYQAAAWAEEAPVPAIKQMDGATKAKVLAALAGLIILGFAMVAAGGRGGVRESGATGVSPVLSGGREAARPTGLPTWTFG
jgi:hypothetical protein